MSEDPEENEPTIYAVITGNQTTKAQSIHSVRADRQVAEKEAFALHVSGWNGTDFATVRPLSPEDVATDPLADIEYRLVVSFTTFDSDNVTDTTDWTGNYETLCETRAQVIHELEDADIIRTREWIRIQAKQVGTEATARNAILKTTDAEENPWENSWEVDPSPVVETSANESGESECVDNTDES